MFLEKLQRMFGRGLGRPPAVPASAGSAAISEENLREFVENSADVLFRIGPDQLAHYVSPSSLAVFGWSPEEMTGRGPASFVHADDLPELIEMAVRIGSGQSQGEVNRFRMWRKDGTLIWIESSSRLMRDPASGERGDMFVIMRDISDRVALEAQLAMLANTDALTGLANRRAFDDALARDWARTLRESGQLSLLLLDVDHFKAFNDSYGHQVGDDCLRAVAAALATIHIGEQATVARYGGEELAMILPGIGAEGAATIGEAARLAVERLDLRHGNGIAEDSGCVTVSVGAATVLARTGASLRMPEALLTAADTAMYKAKQKGRNRVEAALLLSTG